MDRMVPKFKGIQSYEQDLDQLNRKNKSNLMSVIKDETNNAKKREKDNEKRLQTLQEKQNREKTQQLLVNEAINCNKRVNKRIVFDQQLDDNKQELFINPKKFKSNDNNESLVKTKQLFGNDSDSDEEEESDKEFEFKLNKKISDKNAEKLIELNSRFAHDVRFKIDERFLDLDKNKDNDNYEEVIDEKGKNMHLLEEVLGKKMKPIIKRKDKSNESNNNINSELFVSRFDPTNKKSSIYEVFSSDKKKKVTFDNNISTKEKPVVQKEDKVENVSKEVYYEVSSALKNSLANKEEEFSLTQMFGNQNDFIKTDLNNEQHLKSEKSTQNKSNKNLNSLPNPFRYDSSSEEEEEVNDNRIIKNDENTKRIPVIHHKFFFSENDPRFTEDLFYRKDLVERARNNWKERQLMIIKAMGLRKRSAKKNKKSAQKRIIKTKNGTFTRFKS